MRIGPVDKGKSVFAAGRFRTLRNRSPLTRAVAALEVGERLTLRDVTDVARVRNTCQYIKMVEGKRFVTRMAGGGVVYVWRTA